MDQRGVYSKYTRAVDKASREVGRGVIGGDRGVLKDTEGERGHQTKLGEQVKLRNQELRSERTSILHRKKPRLHRELLEEKIRKARGVGEASILDKAGATERTGKDALGTRLVGLGTERRATCMGQLKGDFAFRRKHADAVVEGFIAKDFNRAQAFTARAYGSAGRLADGRTAAKYTAAAICTGEDFLDDFPKTDAERAGSRASYEVGERGAARGNRERDAVCAPASAAEETRRRGSHDRALGSHPHCWFEAGQYHPLPRQDLRFGKDWEADATDERWPSRRPRAGPFEGYDRGGFMWKWRGRASTARKQSPQHLRVRSGGGGRQLWDTERRELVDDTSRVAADAAGATGSDPLGKLAPLFSPIATAGQDLEYPKKKCNDFDADGGTEKKGESRKGATSVVPRGRREEGTKEGKAQTRERERVDRVGVGNFARGNRLDGGDVDRGSLRERVARLESKVNSVKAGMAGAYDFGADGSAEGKEESRKGTTSVIPHGRREKGPEEGGGQVRERERWDYVGIENFARGNRLDGGDIDRGSLRENVTHSESEVNSVKTGRAGAQPRLMVGAWVADGGVGVGRASGLPPADSLGALPGAQKCMTCAQHHTVSFDVRNSSLTAELRDILPGKSKHSDVPGPSTTTMRPNRQAKVTEPVDFPAEDGAWEGGPRTSAVRLLGGSTRRGSGSDGVGSKLSAWVTEGGDALSPRDRVGYRRRIVEMDAEHQIAPEGLVTEMEADPPLFYRKENARREPLERLEIEMPRHELKRQPGDTSAKGDLLPAAGNFDENLGSEPQLMAPDDRPGGATKRGDVWVPGMAGIVDRPYSTERGFCVFCDYLQLHLGGLPGLSRLDLPGQSWSKVRLVFGVYLGTEPLSSTTIATPWVETPPRARFSVLGAHETFKGISSKPQTRLVIELQLKGGDGGQDTTLGRGFMHVFKPESGTPGRLTLRAGMTRLALFQEVVNNDVLTVTRPVRMAAFIRLVHGDDVEMASSFELGPDVTQHRRLYANYDLRGKRQKFMTGTLLRAVFVVMGKMKSVVVRRRIDTVMRRRRFLPGRGSSGRRALTGRNDLLGDRYKSDGCHGKKGVHNKGSGKDILNDDTSNNVKDDVSEEKKKEESVEKEFGKPTEEGEDLRGSVASKSNNISRRPFFSGDGFDFYVDRGCGMPYNCTVSKAVLRIIGARQQGSSAVSDADSPSSTPVFGLREEFRTNPGERADATSTAMIRIDTLDRFSLEHRVVGYARVAMFIDPLGNQPTEPSVNKVFLREGKFQLPLYQTSPPDFRKPVSSTIREEEKEKNLVPRVPCASVLVRVKLAPKRAEGRALGRCDVLEEDWLGFGLAPPMPELGTGEYDDSEMKLTELERESLRLRATHTEEGQSVFEAAKLVASKHAPVPESDIIVRRRHDFKQWAISVMAENPAKAIDFHRTEKYREERGFSVRVAGLANMKPPGMFKPPRLYKVIFSLLKPGLHMFYLGEQPVSSNHVEFTLAYDLRSPQTAPRFDDPPRVFSDQKIDKAQCVVLDVRFLKVNGKEIAAVPEEPRVAPASGAWGLLPVFTASDLAAGNFVVPLFSGPFPAEALKSGQEPMQAVLKNAGTEEDLSFRPLKGSSVVVQICNALVPDSLVKAKVQNPTAALDFSHVKRLSKAVGIPQHTYEIRYKDKGRNSIDSLVSKAFKGHRKLFFDATNDLFAETTGIQMHRRAGVEPRCPPEASPT